VMDISPVFFYLFAGLAIGCSLMTVFNKNPVSSAFSLVLVFFSFAGMYALLGAHLIATLQILVYAGAIMVLFVFVIMLLSADSPSFDIAKTSRFLKGLIALGVLGLLGMFAFVFKNYAYGTKVGDYTPEKIMSLGGNTRLISELMFTEYLLPFELTSILILGATVGAVAIAKRKLTSAKESKHVS